MKMQILLVLRVVHHIGEKMRKYFLALGKVLLHFYLGKCRYPFAITEYQG
jgi:hypothetical protein